MRRDDKKLRHFQKAAFSFSERVKTVGTPGKINVIWWNIKINLYKKIMWICIYVNMNGQQICKISRKKT